MMQSLHNQQHQQQQQLAALLAAALPKETSSSSSSSTTTTTATSSSEDNDSSAPRISAITSLHRAILYPPNSLLVNHSASFLFHGFSQLLSDKSSVVRQAAATAYGALCGVLCSVPVASNVRPNHALINNLVDRFMGWALPLLRVEDGMAELALESLREFLSVGDIGAVERYVLPVLKACQQLLEDERTSLSLLHRILGVLTLISLKFFRCFQTHFVDIVDLLLGWAMVPDLADPDRRIIMDSFLQFQKHWVNNLHFSLDLLSKFLGDMDVLLQDVSPGTHQQYQRLLVLLFCFSTVLQSTASGLLEINLLEQIWEPLAKMLPTLLAGLSMVGKKFGWSKWIGESWRCLTLLAEILGEKFSSFYSSAVDILFQSLEMDNTNHRFGVAKMNSFQIHGVLRTNLQLLSLQKHGLLPSSARKILQFYAPISQLRLHPNHLVTGSSAAAYMFLLQHRNNEVVEQAITSLIEELQLLKSMLQNTKANAEELDDAVAFESYSCSELFAFLKFDLKVLLCCVSLGGDSSLIGQPEIVDLHISRSQNLIHFIIENLSPFEFPIQDHVELQANIVNILGQLTAVNFLNKCSARRQKDCPGRGLEIEKVLPENSLRDRHVMIIFEHLEKYSVLLVNALHLSSPLVVKLEAVQWIQKFCESVIGEYEKLRRTTYPCQMYECANIVGSLLISLLDAASDKEPKVRSHVPIIIRLLLQARLVHSTHFGIITEVVLERLGDPDKDVRHMFVKLLSDMLPMTLYACGMCEDRSGSACTSGIRRLPNRSNLHWKQIFALKQLPQQLHSQQLVSVLSYISQRWKVPLSSWIQRLIYTCRRPKDIGLTQLEEAGHVSVSALWWDKEVEENILERICSVNILASAWWAIHEAARYCISTRLRTNLGGPTQTFAALERMLLDIALVLHVDSEQSDGNLKLVGSSYAHLLPLRLLLDFVEALKKNVYNAYDGSIVLAPASRQSSLFFRANKKVCEEWFSRICEPMMNAGLSLQCHDATVHYCTLRLQELSNQVATSSMEKNFHNIKDRFLGDVLRILRHMALALCRMHESEALIGLQKWASMTFFSLFTQDNCSLVDHEIARPLSWIMGLKYQAEGQYEKAAAHFTHLLQMEDSLSTMGSDGVHFAIARIVESYDAISDWKSLDSWLSELHKLRAKHVGKSYSGALTMAGIEMNAINAMAHFDEGDYQAAWAYLDLTPKSSSELTLDPKLALQRSEQMLLQAMLFHNEGMGDKVSTEIQKAKSMLDEALSVLPLDGLAEAAAHVSQLHCISALEENCNVGGVQDNQLQSILSSYIQAMQSPINQVHQDCKLWLKVLRVYRSILPTAPVTLLLCKNLLTLARTQSNLMLANRLNNYLRHHILNCSKEGSLDFMIPSMEYEGILLMHAEKKFESALINLWAFVKPCLISPTETVSDADDNFLLADACLKFSDWVRQNCSDTSMEDFVLQLRAELNVNESSPFTGSPNCNDDNLSSRPRINVFVEELAGTLKKLSTSLCPTMGRSWISYASWCFNQAKANLFGPHEAVLESCSFSPNLNSDIIPDRFKLTEEELTKVRNIVSEHLIETINPKDSGQVQEVCDFDTESSENHPREVLVQQVINIIEAAAGAPGAEDVAGECFSTTLASRLQKCFQIDSVGTESTRCLSFVDDLLDVWLSLRSRRVSLFGQAAQAYINYLRYSSLVGSDGQLPVCGSNLLQKSESHSLRATLYVLHILLNYGVELKHTLEPALATVPLLPWQEITPQLFARVSFHPEQVVRKQLEGMLIMLAKLSPWSVVYPTLVDVNSYEEEPPEELQHILACLSKLYPRLIQDVQLMVKELENVTILWEELWLTTLQDLHTDVIRRINLLKEEAARIAENTTLSQTEKNKINAAKYSAMMAPIFVALERRLASTSRKPETPHEIWFHQEYKEQIKMAVLNFKTPPATASALGDVWRPFDIIAASLASYQRKSSISLGDVAPQLAQLSSSDVPMPGLEKQITISDSDKEPTSALQGIVTIASFSEDITILPTKTRPKKLVIMGSDGQTYPYLLKGREDLRLDARIMQLLQAINGFLHSPSSTCDQVSRIRYYSVTPISGRAGLIQWVDNVTSIYSIFKSWQSRVQFAQHSALASNTKNSVPPPVPRPSDMFYGKIIPALKEKGLRRVISRRDWPHEVKRKVFLDLVKETPKQLLHQELWCASEGFKAFSSKLKRYSSSLAAMSMIGHILGLGDRHLDNILMDFCSGEIVHIDYNVCFDKGQRLKIPEIVPFRLTQTMEAALGLTGVEGTFRASCEAVLTVLKNNKDMLLMLLEVFVWDPLVEWTRGDFHDDAAIVGEERKGMELAVSLSLFASRVQEMRVPLQEHHDLLVASFPAIESALMRFTNILNEYETIFTLFTRADKERSNILHRVTSARSIVVEATNNLEKTRVTYDMQAQELAQTKALVAEKAEEAETWIEQHGKVIDGIRSSSIPEIKASINLSGKEKILSLTSAVLVAGVPLTVVPEPTQVQCLEIDREVSLLMSELDYGLTSAVTCLQTYSLALQRVLPLNYLSTSPVHNWAQVLHLLLNTISSDLLSLAKRQAAEHNLKGHVEGIDSVKSCYDDLCQKVEKYGEGIKKLEEERLELVISIGSGTELAANDHLLSTFISYMQSTGLGNEDPLLSLSFGLVKHERTLDSRFEGKIEEKEKIITILNIAVSSLYSDVKHRVLDIFNHTPDGRHADTGTIFCKFEEQVEKCVLLAGFVNEVQQYIESNAPTSDINLDSSNYSFSKNWAAILKTSLISCKGLAEKLLDAVLPDAIRAVISFSSEVMDSFGSLSQIRGSIDTALEDLIQVEIERASLADLVQSYFLNVGLVTEQQLALEEAALKGRDHLSWEEAEELASQEEACRAQLDKLHFSWNQKDMRTSSLVKRESSIKSALLSAEHHIQSLCSNEQDRDPQNSMSKNLLVSLMQPFFELESVDKALSSFVGPVSSHLTETLSLKDLASSGCPLSEYVWKLSGILNSRSFFIWKVVVIDSFLNSCIHDAASSAELNLGFDQLVDNVRKKLERQLQGHLNQYLRERVAPIFLARLDTETELLKQNELSAKLIASDDLKKEFGAVKRVKLMLEEYCNAHETVRAAISAASLMNKQVNELRESLLKTTLDIVQMEWIHDRTLNPMRNYRLISHKFLASMDNLLPVILNLSRPKLLESIQSSVAKIARSLEGLQACEQNSVTAERQLERAMGWACGASNSSSAGNTSAKNTGIPPEFHDHLLKRGQLLLEVREKGSEMIKVCMSVLEFEASRDGIFQKSGELYPSESGADATIWQQIYSYALTRLDVTYHSFMRTEEEWQRAQRNMETASRNLSSASNELSVTSVKAKSAADNLQRTLIAMKDCASEASVVLSAFARVTRGHAALTAECGSMLDEVLAITDGLHDVHSLGKEAAALHMSLMEDLSKANTILLPLESVLSKDVAAMTDAMEREKETKMEISPIHGQAIHQSYYSRIKEAFQSYEPLVPSLTSSVKGLHLMLSRLARVASLHSGNLHKALEGLRESKEISSEDVNVSRPDLEDNDQEFDNNDVSVVPQPDRDYDEDSLGMNQLSIQDKGWISPPDSIYTSSSESGELSDEAVADNHGGSDLMEQCSNGHGSKTNDNIMSSVSESMQSESLVKSIESPSHSLGSQEADVKLSERALSSQYKVEGNITDAPPSMDTNTRVTRGKNAYAVSILRRVEMKLDGQDIASNREISIAEQVDHLIKQATSIDNLCNMYEGWTPWI